MCVCVYVCCVCVRLQLLRCEDSMIEIDATPYEAIIRGFLFSGGIDDARAAWKEMEDKGISPSPALLKLSARLQ